MNFGLKDRDLRHIIQALHQYPEIEEAILFGSRAMGTFKQGSDIDLAIKGKNINHHVMARLNNDLQEELPIPFFFDLVDFNTITSTALREHIKRVGIIIYPTYE